MDAEMLRNYKALRRLKDDLKSELALVEGRLAEAENEILTAFANEGVTSIKLDDATFSTSHKLWASVNSEAGYAHAVEALTACGLGDVVARGSNINSNVLSAAIRELVDQAGEVDALDARLRAALNIHEKFTLSLRRG